MLGGSASIQAFASAAMQPMVMVSIPALLGFGFIVGIVLVLLGLVEQKNQQRRAHLMAAGVIVLGIMSVVTPLLWYGYPALLTGVVVLNLGELVILTLLALISGLLIAYGIQLARTRD
jgi:FtsH-binding integral membrane protein